MLELVRSQTLLVLRATVTGANLTFTILPDRNNCDKNIKSSGKQSLAALQSAESVHCQWKAARELLWTSYILFRPWQQRC